MKVLTPGRVALTFSTQNSNDEYFGGPCLCTGIPLGEDLIDVPSYFNQISSGNEVNDVIHAKVVDDLEHSLLVADQSLFVGKVSYLYKQALRANGELGSRRPSWFSWNPFIETSQEYWTEPSPNYKGKKAHTPSLRIKKSRSYYHFCFEIETQVSRHYLYGWYLSYLRVDVYCPWIIYPHSNFPFRYRRRYRSFSRSKDGLVPGSGGSTGSQCPPLNSFFDDIPNNPLFGKELFFKDVGELHQAISTALMELDPKALSESMLEGSGTKYLSCYSSIDAPFPTSENELKAHFILQEPEVFVQKLDPLMLGKDVTFSNYWRNYLTEHALLAACESLPKLNDNSIQNIIEIVSFIKALVMDRKIEMPHSLSDAWLSYRYSFSTSKMDFEEAINFFGRVKDLGGLDRSISSYGRSSHQVNGVDVRCTCCVEVVPKELSTLKKIWNALDTYGLTPDFYVVWDSIPYSFMVDWFLPIGNLAGVLDANNRWFSGEYYTFRNISYSFSYTRRFATYYAKFYCRWAGQVPSGLNSFYWLEPSKSGSKTWIKRLLDAGSIFIGL